MRKVVFVLAFILAMVAGSSTVSARQVKKVYHFADTLKSMPKRDRFMRAIDRAPEVFVYNEIVQNGPGSVTVKGMRFNDSIQNTLASEFCAEDPKLKKNLTRVGHIVKPLNAIIDLTVDYKQVPKGIAVSYTIDNINIFGKGKVPDDSQLKAKKK